VEATVDGEFLRCESDSKGFFACKDGLYPHISVADREKLKADNPMKVCYDADGKDEPPCKKEGKDPIPYRRDRNLGTVKSGCVLSGFSDETACGDGKVPGLASTRPAIPNVCADTNIAPLCSDEKNNKDGTYKEGSCH